jgi:hypothetical protein
MNLGKIPTAAVLFLLLFSIYAATMSGRILYGDEIEKYRVAQSIVDRHELSFRATAQRNEVGVAGRTYSIYELGQTLVEVPFYAAGRLAFTFFPTADVDWIGQLFVGWLNPLLTALTAVLLYLTCVDLGFRRRTAMALALVFGLATIAAPYVKGFTREPLLSLLLLSSVFALVRFEKTNLDRWMLTAGVAAGYLVFSKFIHAVVIPCLIGYLLAVVWQRQQVNCPKRRDLVAPMLRALFIFLLPAIVFLMVQSLYGIARFGTPFGGIAGTRYNPFDWILYVMSGARPAEAIMGLLFSPEKSVFLYSPPVLLGAVAWFEWVRVRKKQALLFLALGIVEFASAVTRLDWDGGSWWGPRYLVQVMPLGVIPIAALEGSRRFRRALPTLVALVASAGLFVQIVGSSGQMRDYMDATGQRITLVGQLDFLRHGAFDSLVFYFNPAGFQVNPYGLVLVLVGLGAAAVIVSQFQSDTVGIAGWSWRNALLLSIVVLIEVAAFIAWVVAPYSEIRTAQGNGKFVAGNVFLADGRTREAAAMYGLALDYGSAYQLEASERLEELTGRARGDAFSAYDLMRQVEAPENAVLTADRSVVLKGEASLKLAVPGEQDDTISTMSDWIPALPGATYEVSGWLKTENIYGSGYGVVSVYEDNGVWQNPRKADVMAMDETGGWSLFRKRITTQPTTRRFLISVGLWNTYGTLWLDDLELARVSNP